MTNQDLSRFTLSSKETDEKEKKTIFSPPEIHEEDKKPFIQYFTKNPLWIGVYAILLFVAVVCGVYLFRTGSSSKLDIPPALPMVTPIQENIPTPSPEEKLVDFSLFSVTVLNGSGIAGEAGRVKILLEEGGFSVSKTGNADRYDYEETLVYVKENVPDQVTEALQNIIGDISVMTDETYPNEDADVVIIAGRQ